MRGQAAAEGRCRIPLASHGRPLAAGCCPRACTVCAHRSARPSATRGDKWSRQHRDAQLPLLEIRVTTWRAGFRDWCHTFLAASYPTHRRPLNHAHPPMHLHSIQPHATAALKQSDRAATGRRRLVGALSGEAESAEEAVDGALRHVLARTPRLHLHPHPPGPRRRHPAHRVPPRCALHRNLPARACQS